MSIAGGKFRAIERARRAGCNVLQIFVKNSNRWQEKDLTEQEVQDFQHERDASLLQSIVAHDSYLINLASPQESLWRRSRKAFLEELERAERLGLDYLVTHPGAHLGSGESRGIGRIACALDWIHERTEGYRVRIALETTAGQGTTLGHRFEHLRDILGRCRHPDRIFVCVDTCHLFAAGYDFRGQEGYHQIMEEFDRILGEEKLKIFHVNDSKRELGSRVDRHEHIGQGCIGTSGFRWILNDPRWQGIPKILETPKGEDLKEDRRNLRVLRSLVRAEA